MPKKIETTGDLREMLCDAINQVADGTMQPETARNITKEAGRINDSLYAKAKEAKKTGLEVLPTQTKP
ncbi:hypothetical protein GO003_002710 [Methylicorpusculum oleiharenae]|uniref:hypothetical protein n=1 Tax=Methylicorpusculum oleiharenae TaxID=1338687 RepID=UPI0013586E47|nr:hypothetical protein [Methylicorpusculum oleiharenae]MCD2449299.1 hypothetical protein [Methylicorpusculum oleiharenae]